MQPVYWARFALASAPVPSPGTKARRSRRGKACGGRTPGLPGWWKCTFDVCCGVLRRHCDCDRFHLRSVVAQRICRPPCFRCSVSAPPQVQDSELIKQKDDWVIEETNFCLGRMSFPRFRETDDLARRTQMFMAMYFLTPS